MFVQLSYCNTPCHCPNSQTCRILLADRPNCLPLIVDRFILGQIELFVLTVFKCFFSVMDHAILTVRSSTPVCSSAVSVSLSELCFTQTHSWAKSCHSHWQAWQTSHSTSRLSHHMSWQPCCSYSRLFQANVRLFQAIQDYSRLF